MICTRKPKAFDDTVELDDDDERRRRRRRQRRATTKNKKGRRRIGDGAIRRLYPVAVHVHSGKGRHATIPSSWITTTTMNDDEREGKKTHRTCHETSALPCCGTCPWRKSKACDDTVEFDFDDVRRREGKGREGKDTHRRCHETSDLPCCGKCP